MKIEICNTDNSGVNGYEVYDLSARKRITNDNNSQLANLNRYFDESDVYELIGESQYKKFLLGKHVFNATKKQIFAVSNNLNYFTMPK